MLNLSQIIVALASLFLAVTSAFSPRQPPTPLRHSTRLSVGTSSQARQHMVDGSIECTEVSLTLPVIGSVTLLEATAETQEVLVNLAIEDDLENLPSGDPYGAVLWPASTTIASHLLESKERLLEGQSILELGTGTGLISLAATIAGARSVLATDYETIPLKILDYAASNLNGIKVGDVLNMELLDLCDPSQPLPAVDVVVAADVMYEPATGKALARRVVEALSNGSCVLIGDSPGRAGRPAFLEELHKLGLEKAAFVDRLGWTVTGDRHDLICGAGSTTVSALPEELVVAVMELHPDDFQEAIAEYRESI